MEQEVQCIEVGKKPSHIHCTTLHRLSSWLIKLCLCRLFFRIKKERIATLEEEIDGLRAMRAHLEDKIGTKVEAYRQASGQKKALESRRAEALALGRELAAQHIAVEMSILFVELQVRELSKV